MCYGFMRLLAQFLSVKVGLAGEACRRGEYPVNKNPFHFACL
jgi:hypothetical protein